MLLGGLRYLLPVIATAHRQGYHVITVDYLPNNIAHKYSDEYYNVSIVDKKAVLALAKELDIDGIMSFAVDPGVITAAYVQEQMGLPSCGPYESVCILQNKDKFRNFLTRHGFTVPKAKGFSSVEEALSEAYWFPWPVIVKPADSAGSKGVTRVDRLDDLSLALKYAFDHSISKRVIVEEFIEKVGCSSDSDCFSIDGELKFCSFSAQRFDEQSVGPYVPAAYSWPSTMTPKQEETLTSELQRLLKLLKMETTIYNVETRIGKDGKAYIMEVSPRGGGNRLSEMLHYATGVDLITAAVRAAVGDTIDNIEQQPYKGHWAEIILHADRNGKYDSLEIEDSYKSHIQEIDLWVKPGDNVSEFKGANDAIGTLVLNFETSEDLERAMQNLQTAIKVNVK